MNFNQITVIGHLGRDPELRYTPQGKAVADFSMATNTRKKDKSGEWQSHATWWRITLWNQAAENVTKYCKKGDPVLVVGEVSQEEWTDRDGNTRTTLAIAGSQVKFLSSTRDSGEQQEEPQYTGPQNTDFSFS